MLGKGKTQYWWPSLTQVENSQNKELTLFWQIIQNSEAPCRQVNFGTEQLRRFEKVTAQRVLGLQPQYPVLPQQLH
jgi:hypothetical protein